jgi:CheY-like chemotaxis protein
MGLRVSYATSVPEDNLISEVRTNCVLLVDDDPSIRGLLAWQLAKAGLEAVHAEDGIDAVVRLREIVPRVVVSDLQMPRMAGLEFIGVVRRRFPTIPVVVLSGGTPGEFPEQIKPDRYFDKSMRLFPDLVRAVKELAQKTPDRINRRQVIPIRIRPSGTGPMVLNCTDCLRSLEAARTPAKNQTGEHTAVCPHCDACVSFFIESPPVPRRAGTSSISGFHPG